MKSLRKSEELGGVQSARDDCAFRRINWIRTTLCSIYEFSRNWNAALNATIAPAQESMNSRVGGFFGIRKKRQVYAMSLIADSYFPSSRHEVREKYCQVAQAERKS